MSYYTGTASDMSALRQALIDACVTEGWAWDGASEVLSKGAMFLRLQVISGYLSLLGRTSAAGGDMPNSVRIGQLGSTPVTFPLTYEIFAFVDEVYLVANYSLDYFQWCAFGLSTVDALPGTGMWVGASIGSATALGIIISPNGGGSSSPTTTAALFHHTAAESAANRNAWIHSGLDGQDWWLAQSLTGLAVGIRAVVPLLGILPSAWNSEAALLPIRAYKVRPSAKLSLTADLENARYTRVDNYSPGQVLQIGSDRWKIFPWYRKNSAERDGGISIDHTGTLGWAIRYEGP